MSSKNNDKMKFRKQSLSLTAFDSSLYTREPIVSEGSVEKFTITTHLWVASSSCMAGRPIKSALVRSH